MTTNQLTTAEKVTIAAQFLGSNWNQRSSRCVYHDDSMGAGYVCESPEEMVDLYDLITSDDSDTRRDAYSIWCAQTTHEMF